MRCGPKTWRKKYEMPRGNKAATAAEQERLVESIKDMLLRLDYLHGDNRDYF